MIIPFLDAKRLIKEGDVLLFRPKGWIGFLISRITNSPYCHVGVASLVNEHVECIEFLHKKGGRAISLEVYLKWGAQIDVYRPIPYFTKWVFDEKTHDVALHTVEFDGKKVTQTMRQMTGLPYGFRRLLWILKFKTPIIRLFFSPAKLIDDELGEVIYPLCSTSLSYSFNKYGFDLVNNKADEWTEPSEFAESTRLSYLFSLSK